MELTTEEMMNFKRKSDAKEVLEFWKRRRLEKHTGIVSMNKSYFKHNFKEKFSRAFTKVKPIVFKNGAKVITKPFPCGLLPNFIESDLYLQNLKAELLKLEKRRKDSDLFKFVQSQDFKSYMNNFVIGKFRELFLEDVLGWLRTVTNIPLADNVDMSCSVYQQADFLLCHDDRLEDRKIAFIYYLVPPDWSSEDGGTLDLFSSRAGNPTKIHTSITPEWNCLLFFEVSPHSFHQVSEILSDKTRITISGWFHAVSESHITPEVNSSLESQLIEWINPIYLMRNTLAVVRAKFEADSGIELQGFLQKEKYTALCEELRSSKNSDWILRGPPNRRSYELTLSNRLKTVVKFKKFLKSSAFAHMVKVATGLNFLDDFGSNLNERRNSMVVRRWSHGKYTLLYGEANVTHLDAIVYFNCEGYSEDIGGYTIYFDTETSEPVIDVVPKCNTLSLLYVKKGTSKFVKYINKSINSKMPKPCFYDAVVSYVENEDEQDDEDESEDSEDNLVEIMPDGCHTDSDSDF